MIWTKVDKYHIRSGDFTVAVSGVADNAAFTAFHKQQIIETFRGESALSDAKKACEAYDVSQVDS